MKKLSDISLVSYLRCKEFNIIKVEKQKEKAFFHFEESSELEEEIYRYYNNKTTVDPVKFNEMLRNLKSLAKQG